MVVTEIDEGWSNCEKINLLQDLQRTCKEKQEFSSSTVEKKSGKGSVNSLAGKNMTHTIRLNLTACES